MGTTGAMGMADAVNDGLASLDTALSWHLQSNHYPPVPSAFIASCKAAIEAGQDEDYDREIALPKGCNTHRTLFAFDGECAQSKVHGAGPCEIVQAVLWKDDRDVVRAGDLIESMHLDAFVWAGLEDDEPSELRHVVPDGPADPTFLDGDDD